MCTCCKLKWATVPPLTLLYIICSTVGQSIASISDLNARMYLGTFHLGKYGALVEYISYGPPYCTMYITYMKGFRGFFGYTSTNRMPVK